MKTKLLFALISLAFCVSSALFSQNKQQAKDEKAITWYGIDFTKAKFTLVTEDPTVIVNQYLKSINQLIQAEPEKFDLKKWFNKVDVAFDIDQVNERNSKIDPGSLVISDEHTITPEDVKAVISKYNTKGKSGLGLIFVAEDLHKVKQTGSYYVVFFNQDTKEIIDSERFEVKAVGIGFRNYWAGSVFNIMKIWLKGK
ncbi:MAG TPA: hypothetical protein VK179_16710 [Bacteroidales bacterium]|nr:hypothetical protein [Bacteroidales bacterium]